MAQAPDGSYRGDQLGEEHWRKIASLVVPLARCLVQQNHPASSKTKHAASLAVATLASLSAVNIKAKVILVAFADGGVVDAFVATLRQSLRNPCSDRVIRATLYKLIDSLMGLACFASTAQQRLLVGKDVVDVCLELVTSGTVETESKLLASKTLYNCIINPDRVVTALRTSKVTALNAQLQQLAAQIPDPATVASGGKAISMPVLLPSIMTWVWLLPDYIVDHLEAALSHLCSRLVVLVWPEGAPGIAQPEPGAGGAAGGEESPALQVAIHSLPNRSLRQTFASLMTSVSSDLADPRLVRLLRGARLPPGAGAGGANGFGGGAEEGEGAGMALPARLVRVLQEGRPDGMEAKVVLEMLDEVFAAEAKGHPELADDALAAGLLRAMTAHQVFNAMRTEHGMAGLQAFVRLSTRLCKRAAYTPTLAARLRESGVPASVAYLAFWPGGKLNLKLEALQALHLLVQLDPDTAERVVLLPNFPSALVNALLGGDPETRRAPKKPSGSDSRKKKAGGGGAAGGTGAAAATAAASTIRDQLQEAALEILSVVLDVARETEKVWQVVVESRMIPRLLQFLPLFPMGPGLAAEALGLVGATFKEHAEDTLSVGGLQAACAPHLLPLLSSEEPSLALSAARLLADTLADMVRYRRDAADVELGDEILKELVAAGKPIDTADEVAAAAAAATARAAAKASGSAGMKAEDGSAAGPGPGSEAAAVAVKAEDGAGAKGPGVKQEPGAGAGKASTSAPDGGEEEEEEIPELVDVTTQGLGLLAAALAASTSAVLNPPPPLLPRASRGAAALAATPPPAPNPTPGPVRLDGGAAECLPYLLRCCAILAESVKQLPPHAIPRKHLARAFAYALAPAEEMAAALKARGGASLGAAPAAPKASAVLEAAERTVQGLRAIPVLDVALLPKPKPKEDDEDGEKGPDPAEKPKARKGRPTGTANKRASQSSLQAGAAAGAGAEGDAAAANPPAKRQRTLTPAAAALAADAKRKTSAAAAAATAATTPTAAGGGVSTPLAGSAPSAAQALPPGGPLDDGRGAVNLPRWDSDGRNPISIARVGSSSGPMQGDGRSLARPSSNAAAAGSGGVPMVSADGAGVSSLPAAVLSARDRATSAAASLPPGLAKPVRAPPPGSAPLPPVPLPLSESPSTSLDGRGALGTSGGGAGVLAPTSSGGAAGAAAAAAAGRVSVAEIKARFQEVKAQNATLTAELDASKRAVAAAEAAKAQTAAILQARNAEVDQLLAALDERTKQAAALGERLAAREAEVAALQAANARLQQELDQLNDIDLE